MKPSIGILKPRRHRWCVFLHSLVLWIASAYPAFCGPFAPGAGQAGSTAVSASDSNLVLWGSAVGEMHRGPRAIFDPEAYGEASFGVPENALQKADVAISEEDQQTFSILSLGDGGSITLRFSVPFRNGPGSDFAVFENSFSDTFLELAFVEVSSDGVHFSRFPSVSLTPTAGIQENIDKDDFSTLDPTNLHNLAGKYRGGFGTPFNLDDLAGAPDLDVNSIVAVRVIDVVGSIDPRWATHDSLGNIIKDPFPTVFPSGGFDLDAIGAFYPVPEPSFGCLVLAGSAPLLVWRRRR
jgi:hypothetical protein